MKVLVTGGAGFIGSNLCEYLLGEGHEVRCMDNFCTGKPENVIPLLEKFPDSFSLVVGDIRSLEVAAGRSMVWSMSFTRRP